MMNEEALAFYEANQGQMATGRPWDQLKLKRWAVVGNVTRSKVCSPAEAREEIAAGRSIFLDPNSYFGVEQPYEGRYLTNWYAATTRKVAEYHSSLDHTPTDKIEFTPDVRPVHVGDCWVLWSDGKFSFKVGSYPEYPKSLSEDAARLITTLKGADGGSVYLEGGYGLIARIARVDEEKQLVYTGARAGGYAGHSVTRYKVTLTDDTKLTFYARSVGYFEGYAFDIYATQKAAYQELQAIEKWAAGWREEECLECGTVYDEPGHVEPGQMSCERCG